MKEKLKDLLPWLEKLLVTLAGVDPDADRDEVERRLQLTKFVSFLRFFSHLELIPRDRSLEDIGARALTLSEKGKVARVLDKTKDSGEVIALVEKLRRAIVIYQVSSGRHQCWKYLTRRAGITATVYLQPGRTVDREFLPLVFNLETKQIAG